MKRIFFTSFILLFCVAIFAQSNSTKSINLLSFKTMEIVNNSKDNCFFSPYSMFGALAMTYEGAVQKTKLEIEKTLEIEEGDNVSESYQKLSKDLDDNKSIEILTSNSLWLHQTFKLQKNYLKLLNSYYSAKAKNVDFASSAGREKARKEINTWVEKQTNKMIKEFIKKGVLTEATGLVLINAVYFKGMWADEFLESNTTKEKFLASAGKEVDCQMMNNNTNAKYFEDEKIQVVEIPYKNQSASMIILLTKDKKNDYSFVDYTYFKEAQISMRKKKVKLSIPKFKMDVDYELSETLRRLGMKTAFSSKADFSNMTGNKDVKISSVMHRSVIDVNEKGTEASSTTAVIANRSTMIKDIPVVFKADHPFLFVIKENKTNAILFMGYLAQPNLIATNNESPKMQEK